MKAGLDLKTYGVLAEGKGRVLLASSRANEVSLILPGKKNSLFTHYLLDALKGAAGPRATAGSGSSTCSAMCRTRCRPRRTSIPCSRLTTSRTTSPWRSTRGGKKEVTARGYVNSARLKTLHGLTKIELIKRLVDRWEDLADYLEIPLYERRQFPQGNPPRKILEWLEQRERLNVLRDAFNHFGWTELEEVLDRPT